MSTSTASFDKGESFVVLFDTNEMQQITLTHKLKDAEAVILYTLCRLKYSSPTLASRSFFFGSLRHADSERHHTVRCHVRSRSCLELLKFFVAV